MSYSTEKDAKSVSNSNREETRNEQKLIVYQLFPRIFSNMNQEPQPWGSLEQNGCGKLNDITPKVIKNLKKLGVNTLWFTGIIEHATKTAFPTHGIEADNPNVVKGEAGSPYAIKDYYDVAPSLATDISHRMEEFEALVERVHAEGLKVIIDFVPNHTARRYHSDSAPQDVEDFGAGDDTTKFFSPSNNYYYIPNQKFSPAFPEEKPSDPYFEFPAKATGNDCFNAFCSEYDWYETVKLNYGHDYGDNSNHFEPIPDTWLKMMSIIRFWASKGVDGFRCDMVFMVPLPFWHWLIPEVKKDFPNLIFIGEIYDVGQYRDFLYYGHFDYLYDKVNLYDTLVGIEKWNFSAARLSDCWKAVDGIGERMLNFLENHDEVRFASNEFAGNPQSVIPHLVVSAMLTKGPFMIYYGQELGEPGADNEGFAGHNSRTTIFDYWSLDTLRRWYDGGNCSLRRLNAHEKWLRNVYAKVLNMCNTQSAIRSGNFFDLMYVNLQNPEFDPHACFAWLRYDDNEALLLVVNFSDTPRDCAIHIPDLAFEMAALREGMVTGRELLWEDDITVTLRRGEPVRLSLQPKNAKIIKLR